MKYKIITDSSANLRSLDGIDFAYAPLHITVNERDFVDDDNIDIEAMQLALKAAKARSSTACPGPEDYIKAFGDADIVYVLCITGGLSGAYAAANAAKGIYEDEHPGRKVFVFDSLTTGPELALMVEFVREQIKKDILPDRIARELYVYSKKTHLYFSLGALNNFANNGRVNPLLAKGIGLLGMRILGKASDTGTLQPLSKCRGDQKAVAWLVAQMKAEGFSNGKALITHTDNEDCALQLKNAVMREFPDCECRVEKNGGLCSYYAEPMSVLLGFETIIR